MSTTHIDTNRAPRVRLNGQGEVAEVINRELCGAENVLAMLRWLGSGDCFTAESMQDAHQLIYLMEGDGVISLNDKDYDVRKGAGVYLGPSETASVKPGRDAAVKLFHLVVPIKREQS